MSSVEQLISKAGAVAALARGEAGDVITVRDTRGRLLFEWRDGEHGAVIVVPEGDLELRADKGRVRIFGAEGIALEGSELSIRVERVRQIAGVIETHAKRILEKAV